jgi:hypothetical protein
MNELLISTEVAWAAGFYDGEGSSKKIYYRYRTKKGVKCTPTSNVCMSVSQCHLEPLERFKTAIGGIEHINGPYHYKAQKRPYWVWSASCKSARQVFEILKPYLSSIKIRQFEQVETEVVASVADRKKGWIYETQP